jgi:hypothetical protein
MGEIQDVHHPENHRKACRNQEEKPGVGQSMEKKDRNVTHISFLLAPVGEQKSRAGSVLLRQRFYWPRYANTHETLGGFSPNRFPETGMEGIKANAVALFDDEFLLPWWNFILPSRT